MIINLINKILTLLFPFQELRDRPSVFIQESWLETIQRPTQIKDHLWHPPEQN